MQQAYVAVLRICFRPNHGFHFAAVSWRRVSTYKSTGFRVYNSENPCTISASKASTAMIFSRRRKPQGDRKSGHKQKLGNGRRATFRPSLEILEGRQLPSTITVTSNADSGEIGRAHV